MSGNTVWSRRWLRILVLVMAVFATIGAWEAVKIGARFIGVAQADGVTEHLTCYEIHAKSPKEDVIVRDQFYPTGVQVKVGELKLLCTPAVKIKV